jgi:hypothetical protein
MATVPNLSLSRHVDRMFLMFIVHLREHWHMMRHSRMTSRAIVELRRERYYCVKV